MNVCYFGSYKDRDHNRIIKEGLRKNGVIVKECNSPIEDLSDEIGKKGIKEKKLTLFFLIGFLLRLLKNYVILIKKYRKIGDYDVMILGFPGYYDLPLAKLLTKIRRKPLVYDAFISIYETVVIDRSLFKKNTFKAKIFYNMDKYCCKWADLVIVETYADRNYFYKTFGIPFKKMKRSFVGAEDIFKPMKSKKRKKLNVLFYGTYTRLQGIEYIVKAAKLLENEKGLQFNMVGSGQLFDEIQELVKKLDVKNIKFVTKWINYEDLPKLNSTGDICLGIFGDTSKSLKYIPNKAFQALAMRKPLITGDSPAAREGLKNREDGILCKMADEKALAKAILLLNKNKKLRCKIANQGYKTFQEKFSVKSIGKKLNKNLELLVRGRR